MAEAVNRRPTLRDVALRAGVSVGTASGAFSRKPSVSAAARTAVLSAAEELGYFPPRRRAARTDQITAIGLVAWEHHLISETSPYYAPMLGGAQRAAAQLGISMSYETLAVPDTRARRLPICVERRQVQGVLVVGGLSDHDLVERILGAGVACVLIDHGHHLLPLDSVRHDDERGGHLATRYLLEQGHTDPVPAVVAGPPEVWAATERLRGYHRALAEHGLRADPSSVVHSSFTVQSGFAAMQQLLARPVRPTAVFCCNDDSAFGALEALRVNGLSVPDDCSVVGYDDVAPAAYSSPALTTVAVDKALAGAQAVWHLVERIRRPTMSSRDTRLAVRLVERASVRRHAPATHPPATHAPASRAPASRAPATRTARRPPGPHLEPAADLRR